MIFKAIPGCGCQSFAEIGESHKAGLSCRNKRAKAAAKAAALADGAPASAPSSAATAVAVKIVDPLPNQNAVGLTPWERLKARIAALRGRSGDSLLA